MVDTMAVVAKGRKRNPDSLRSRGVDRHNKPKVTFHPPAPLLRAFDDHIDSLRPGTDRTKVLMMIIEEYLATKGLWPPHKTGSSHGNGGI